MMNPQRNITQDDLGRYQHKCLIEDVSGVPRVCTIQVFPDQSGLWIAPAYIQGPNALYELDGTHPRSGVLIYRPTGAKVEPGQAIQM